MKDKTPEPKSSDIVVETLKKRYFEMASKENYPNTPTLTKELDNLEEAIKNLNGKNEKQT